VDYPQSVGQRTCIIMHKMFLFQAAKIAFFCILLHFLAIFDATFNIEFASNLSKELNVRNDEKNWIIKSNVSYGVDSHAV
jgi:hypothetical protein